MIYSLIPAKVKSSRLPGKNTFKFLLGDKPLIAYTIAELFKVNFQPFVFTNESNIENTFGAKIIERSEDLSGSQTTMKETVEAFVNKMNLKNQDTILLTYLTCPFRSAESIKRALKLYEHTGARSLQSLTAVDYRPYGLMKRSKRNEHNYYCLQEQANYYQKQNTPTLYKANGAIYIFSVGELQYLNNQMFDADTVGYVLNEIEGLDIDTEYDLMVAEKILERRNNELLAFELSGAGNSKTEFSPSRSGLHFKYSQTGGA